MNFIDKEYHPIIEEFIVDYADERLTTTERDTFEEVLVSDHDIRKLAHSARDGRKLMNCLRILRKIKLSI